MNKLKVISTPRNIIANTSVMDEHEAIGNTHADAIIGMLEHCGHYILNDVELSKIIDLVLDVSGDYMGEIYGNTALHHPVDRQRIRDKLKEKYNDTSGTTSIRL